MMKQIKTNSGNILIVEVPEDAYDFELDYHNYFPQVYVNFEIRNGVLDFPLTDGNNLNNSTFKIVGKLSELTDKDCEEFIEKHPNIKYKDYTTSALSKAINGWTINWTKCSAKESFKSLLQSYGIDVSNENKLLIIKLI